jgi:hypothetical protein
MSWPETLDDIRRKGMTSSHLRTGRNVAMDRNSFPVAGFTSDVLAGISSHFPSLEKIKLWNLHEVPSMNYLKFYRRL